MFNTLYHLENERHEANIYTTTLEQEEFYLYDEDDITELYEAYDISTITDEEVIKNGWHLYIATLKYNDELRIYVDADMGIEL